MTLESLVGGLNQYLEVAVGYVWGLPLVVLLVGSGISFSILLGGIQFRGFRHAIKVIRGQYDNPEDEGQISHFQALCTALSATVGLGNIAGVAVAIHTGGPGATFWMILVGILGMATKYTEVTLSLMYRQVESVHKVRGGAMYYIEKGLGPRWKPMAIFFAFACATASFGASNMFQVNQVASIFESRFSIPPLLTGFVLSIATAVVIIGGIERIGRVTSYLVPFMGGVYFLGALAVIVLNFDVVPSILKMIFTDAFTGTAAVGGFTGIAFKEVLIQGVRRACFSNEAGLGSSPIAHSAAQTKEPVREGVVALLEPFVDTVIICTMTALVILISGEWTSDLNGVELTARAFDHAIPGFGAWFVPFAVALFAYSTILSWSYYGETAANYLFGEKGVLFYKITYCVVAVLGSVWALGPIVNFADMMLGLMAIPNLIAIWLLFPKVKAETVRYFSRLRA